MTLPILMIKITLKKQNTTRLLYINSCQLQMKPFVWAGHVCTRIVQLVEQLILKPVAYPINTQRSIVNQNSRVILTANF